MGCGCGKGRAGTSNVKERKRTGMEGVITGQGSPTSEYNRRVTEYSRTLQEYRRGKT